MPTAFLQTCRSCDHEFRVLASLVGKLLACPHCRRPMEVRADATAKEDKLVNKELGGCRLIRRLGAGAIGVVYEAQQLSIGRSVAIKMMSSKAATNPKVVQRFQRESKLCAQMQHPNVVSVYDCGFERGVHYLIMEFVEGQTLSSMLDEQERIPWQQATRLVLQVARGLEHAHALGIVHRDIKPANILVANEGTAKLADLGLAKQLDNEGEENPLGLTMQGVALGSPAYMPPEQIRSAKDVTPVCDLYSLGASFYQLVTGALPFEGRSATEVMTKVLREDPKPVNELAPDLPPVIAAFIMRTLSKNPEFRPQSASDFIVELEDALARPDQPAPRAPGAHKEPVSHRGKGRTAGRTASKTISVIQIVVILALLAAVGTVVYLRFFQ